MVTIFDLQKGQKCWGGLKPKGNGFASGSAIATEFTISKLAYHMWFNPYCSQNYLLPIRLTFGSDMVINMDDLFDGRIYLSKEDFINDINPINKENDTHATLLSILGLKDTEKNPEIWTWNEDSQNAELATMFYHIFDLFDIKLPEGYYATKEECEKANKKLVKVKVATESIYELEPEDAEYLLQNPGEYADYDVNIKEHVAFAKSIQ